MNAGSSKKTSKTSQASAPQAPAAQSADELEALLAQVGLGRQPSAAPQPDAEPAAAPAAVAEPAPAEPASVVEGSEAGDVSAEDAETPPQAAALAPAQRRRTPVQTLSLIHI